MMTFKRNKLVLSLVLIALGLASCQTSYRLNKGQQLFQIEPPSEPQGNAEILQFENNLAGKVKIKEVDGNIVITSESSLEFSETDRISPPPTGITDNFRRSFGDKYYFSDPDFIKQNKKVKNLNYSSMGLSLQAINITFKNSNQVRNSIVPAVADSFPSTWSSGFSPALAFGATKTFYSLSPTKKKTEISISAGLFYGLGTTKLDKNSTRLPVYNLTRTALTTTRGFYFNFGFQKWDVGYAFGRETALGDSGDAWIYQNQPFNGLIIGYDIVKLRK